LRRRLAAFEQAQGDPGARAARPDDTARAEELSAVLEAGVSVLAAEYREVFVLREFQRLDYQAIAEVVGCPVGTVRSRLARAREQVRAYVATRYGEDWC
jgi:RNA polymerase sigma-70 factor (ECF subfamily)